MLDMNALGAEFEDIMARKFGLYLNDDWDESGGRRRYVMFNWMSTRGAARREIACRRQ